METKLKMIYWKGEKFWVGKLIEYPDIMTQGETLEELEENMKDAYILMTMDDVPTEHEVKELIFDGLVKSLQMAIFENSHLTNSASYKAEFGKI
jgi:predicted RNase H-like HicB family nuclease